MRLIQIMIIFENKHRQTTFESIFSIIIETKLIAKKNSIRVSHLLYRLAKPCLIMTFKTHKRIQLK